MPRPNRLSVAGSGTAAADAIVPDRPARQVTVSTVHSNTVLGADQIAARTNYTARAICQKQRQLKFQSSLVKSNSPTLSTISRSDLMHIPVERTRQCGGPAECGTGGGCDGNIGQCDVSYCHR